VETSIVVGSSRNKLINVLLRPIFRKTAAYGHFGRDDIEFPWEKTDKAVALKKSAGL